MDTVFGIVVSVLIATVTFAGMIKMADEQQSNIPVEQSLGW